MDALGLKDKSYFNRDQTIQPESLIYLLPAALRHLPTEGRILPGSEWFPSLGPVELRPWVPWGFHLDFCCSCKPLKGGDLGG